VRNKNHISASRTALYGLLIALAFVLGYVESLIPIYLGAPGVKLGLANLVSIIALYCLGAGAAAFINIVRIFLVGVTFGNMSAVLFSLAGAALSLLVMAVSKKLGIFGMVGVSILGGVFHNIGQFLIAAFVVKTFGVFTYFPVLLAAGTVAGALIGLLGGLVTVRIKSVFKNLD
jgi:heptaprenyl diphosphate synthase